MKETDFLCSTSFKLLKKKEIQKMVTNV